ncbi:MAG TPA: hexose kinase [Trebonia sp.]|nr:hexose kinase [Trebonia sp.]
MIVVVCLNPALDVTHRVTTVTWGGVNRPVAVHSRPGGKGVNVARTLHALGADPLLTGLAGGVTGAGIEAALGRLAVPTALTPIAAETRRTFTVVDDGGTVTAFNEAGPEVTEDEFAKFRGQYAEAVAGASAVVLSGSLPAGLAAGAYAGLIEIATAAGVPVVLDTHGEALLLGAAAGAAIVKPNLDELASLAGRPLSTPDGPDLAAVAAAADQLRAAGAGAVVASLGSAGLLATTGDGRWRARPAAVAGNPTGAGDAVVAALAHGLALGRPWNERLRHAAALGAATVAAPVAGEFSDDDYADALSAIALHRDEVG